MKKLEMVIRPEKLDELKVILDECNATGVMVTNIMGYGAQKGFKRIYRGNEYFVNLLPKVKVETVVADDAAEALALTPDAISPEQFGLDSIRKALYKLGISS